MKGNKMTKEDQLINVIEECSEIFNSIDMFNFGNLLKSIVKNDGSKESIDAFMEEVSKYYASLDLENDSKIIMFGDNVNKIIVKKFYIITAVKEWSELYEPLLIVNKMPEDMTIKDNPIKNLIVKYEDIKDRDRDFEKVKRMLAR